MIVCELRSTLCEVLPVFCVCAACGSALLSAPFSAATSPAPSAALFFPHRTRCPPAASLTHPAPCKQTCRQLKKRKKWTLLKAEDPSWIFAHRLMSRSSSCRACSSSDRSSPMMGAVEVSECLRPPVSWLLALLWCTWLLQRLGWYCFRRDKTDWMFARTEWLQLTDWESAERGSHERKCFMLQKWDQKSTRVGPHYLSCNKRYVSDGQSVVRLCVGWGLWRGFLEKEKRRNQNSDPQIMAYMGTLNKPKTIKLINWIKCWIKDVHFNTAINKSSCEKDACFV